MVSRFPLLLAVLGMLCIAGAALAEDHYHPIRADLKFGSHAVGYKSLTVYDKTRYYDSVQYALEGSTSKKHRPIEISIWYPAVKPASGETMKYRHYFEVMFDEVDASKHGAKTFEEHYTDWINGYYSPNEEQAKAFWAVLDKPTGAYLDAEMKAGPWPIVVYGPSYSDSPNENALMFEYYASHGYMVISAPCKSMSKRRMDSNMLGFEAQVRDLEFIFAWAQDNLPVDLDKVAASGFSWGGFSNVMFAARNQEVDLVLGLDGTFFHHYEHMKPTMDQLNPLWHPANLSVPFLDMHRPFKDRPLEPNEWNIYSYTKYSDKIFIRHKNIHHLIYSTREVLKRDFIKPQQPHMVDIHRRQSIQICESTLAFMEYHFRGNEDLKAYLDVLGPSDIVHLVDRQDAIPRPPSQAELMAMLVQGKVDEFVEVIERHTDDNYVPLIDSREVTDHLMRAINSGDGRKAGKILTAKNKMQPNAADRFYYAGEIHLMLGENEEALEMFRKSIGQPGVNTAGFLNIRGYQLIEKNTELSLAFFEIYTELFPKDANAWDSRGEGHMRAGKLDEAKTFYEKSLELNPQNTNAVEMLKKIESMR